MWQGWVLLYFVGVVVDANGCEVHGVGTHTHSAMQSEPGKKSTTECGSQMDINNADRNLHSIENWTPEKERKWNCEELISFFSGPRLDFLCA